MIILGEKNLKTRVYEKKTAQVSGTFREEMWFIMLTLEGKINEKKLLGEQSLKHLVCPALPTWCCIAYILYLEGDRGSFAVKSECISQATLSHLYWWLPPVHTGTNLSLTRILAHPYSQYNKNTTGLSFILTLRRRVLCILNTSTIVERNTPVPTFSFTG